MSIESIKAVSILVAIQALRGRNAAIFFAGSCDGCCTAAAVAYLLGGPQKVGLYLTQAFRIGDTDISDLAPGSVVFLVNVAVADRNPKMTEDFVRRLYEAGHSVVACIDEHDAAAWRQVFVNIGREAEFEAMLIKPCSTGRDGSSSELLLSALGNEADEWVTKLCAAGTAGDKRDFKTNELARLVNSAVKGSRNRDEGDYRRFYVAAALADRNPGDSDIQGWVKEYEELEANHATVLATRRNEGDGLATFTAGDLRVDMSALTLLIEALEGVRVYAVEKVLDRERVPALLFGAKRDTVDVEAAMMAASVPAFPGIRGFREKYTVAMEGREAATLAVRAWLKAKS